MRWAFSAVATPCVACRVTGSLTQDAGVSATHPSVRKAAEPLVIVRPVQLKRDSAQVERPP